MSQVIAMLEDAKRHPGVSETMHDVLQRMTVTDRRALATILFKYF
jgi:hypothetical protein